MASKFLDFYSKSRPSATSMPEEKVHKTYMRHRLQVLAAITFGYALYYVCRTSLNVVKGPILDSGILTASQLGTIGSFLFFAYAIGKFFSGFLADYSNTKRFMATGLLISTLANFLLGVLGIMAESAAITNIFLFISFCILWCINGLSQSMGAAPSVVALSRWYPLRIRGTYYGFFSASHNFGEWLSFLFVGLIVSAFGWKWGFFGAALAGVLGIVIIMLWLHDTPESEGLPSVEVLSGEKTAEEVEAENAAKEASAEADRKETARIQRAVLRNPGVWILALSSAFMYMSRYAINSWGIVFLQKARGIALAEATFIISINAILGIIGTVFSGWLSDTVFKGDRKIPALAAGILETVALVLFLFGGSSRWVLYLSMVLFGISIGVLISFLCGLMAIDLVPRSACGAAVGITGLASYAAAGLQDIVSGILIDGQATVDAAGETVYNFTAVSWFWIAAAAISFLLPLFNWNRKKQEI